MLQEWKIIFSEDEYMFAIAVIEKWNKFLGADKYTYCGL